MGAERRNENLAAASLVKPRKRAHVMVIPLLDTPGTMARACESPTRAASPFPNPLKSLACLATLSARNRRTATPERVHTTTQGDLKYVDAACSSKKPATAPGTVPIISKTRSLLEASSPFPGKTDNSIAIQSL